MNIETFTKVALSLPPDISILVKGDTGIGKSDITKYIATQITKDPASQFLTGG